MDGSQRPQTQKQSVTFPGRRDELNSVAPPPHGAWVIDATPPRALNLFMTSNCNPEMSTRTSFETMSAKTVVQIPVVDLAEFNVTKNAEDASEQVIRQLAAEICQAFGTVGFVSLRNHGILIDKVYMS